MQKKGNVLVCANGHTTHVIEEVAEYEEHRVRVTIRKKKQKVEEGVTKLPLADVQMLLCLDYFLLVLRELKVPYSKCQTYLPLVYTVVERYKKKIKPGVSTMQRYTTMFSTLAYIVKRDTEEENGRMYLINDYMRKINHTPVLENYFINRSGVMNRKMPRLQRVVCVVQRIRLERVVHILHSTLPARTEFRHGIYGRMNETALYTACTALGLTVTQKMKLAYETYTETLKCVRYEEQSRLTCVEYLLGAFLYMYYRQMCEIRKIDEKMCITETRADMTKTVNIVQDFYDRETAFTSFAQINKYFLEVEKTQANIRPVLSPHEFAVQALPDMPADKLKKHVSYITIRRICNTLSTDPEKLLSIIVKIAKTYALMKKKM